ncbi:MAG: glycosyltransferase family 39 protein, partial [Halobacteria archaeon]
MDANRFVRKIQKPSVILGGVIAIAVVLRVAILDRWSLWLDEIYTVRFRGTANLQTVLYDPYDPHPPLYFLLVKGWTYLFGTDPTVVRSLSLIFSVASVLCIYFLTRRIYDRWTGLLASTLFAIVPVHIHFGEIARMYSLLVFLTIISTYFYVRLWERRTGITVLYVLTTSALMYTHVYGIFVVAGQFLHYLLEVKTRDGKPGWKRGVLIYVSIGLIYLPWGIVLSSQVFDLFTPSTGQSPSVGWIPKPSFKLVIDAFETFVGKPWLNPVSAGSNLTYRLVQLNLVIYLIALGNSLTTYDTEDWDMNYKSLLTITFLTPIVLPLIFSVFFKPIFYPRFVLPATVPLTVMVAHGLRAIPYRYTDYGFVAVLIVSSLILTASY